MKFRRLKWWIMRKNRFYEGIIFKNGFVKKQCQKVVVVWMRNLRKYKNIEISRFKELVEPLDEIVFPIKIENCYGNNIFKFEFTDKRKNKYYMQNLVYGDYDKMNTYLIGRRNSALEPLVDRDFRYRILKDKQVILEETGIMQLNQNGTNQDKMVHFYYNHKEATTEAIFSSYTNDEKIKIRYSTRKNDFERKATELFFSMEERRSYYYDVFPILEWIMTQIKDEDISISITAKVREEVCSEIHIVNGIVQRYTFTQIINEGEMQIHKIIFAKDLKEFVEEREF